MALRNSTPLSREERELWGMLERLDGVQQLLDFVPLMTPRYGVPYHLAPLADAFYRASQGDTVFQVSSTPPRHGKTESILHWAAWYLKEHPDRTVAYCTYGDRLSKSKSRKCRDIALKAGVKLTRGSNNAAEWRTPQGGGLIATSVGGALTGQGVNLLIVDDPVKDRKEAESEVYRDAVHEWFTSTAISRLDPGAQAVIVNMARWHDDDLVGRLREDPEIAWEVLNLQAISDTGQALWPEVWDLEHLDVKRRLSGDYDWASLFMGQPMPKQGYLFKEPTRYLLADVAGARIAIGCDPAATAKTSADYSVICVLAARGSGVDQTCDVLDVWRGQVEIPALVQRLLQVQKHWGAPIFVESVGGFKAVPQMLRQISPKLKVVEINPTADKKVRALPSAASWNDGRVRVPRDSMYPWVKPFIKEVCKFTGNKDAKDDQVDAFAHAFNAIDQRLQVLPRGVYGAGKGA